MRKWPVLFILLLSAPVQARVFDFNEKKFSTYLGATYGLMNSQKNAYAPGFPSGAAFPDAGVTQGYSAEAGIGLTFFRTVTLRLGCEFIYPQKLTGLSANNSAGLTFFNFDAEMWGAIPTANIEIILKQTPISRWFIGGGAGYAILTIKNTVTPTSLGASAYNVGNYIEEGTGFGLSGQGYGGFEFSFVDNIAMAFELGYRYLFINNYTSNRTTATALKQYYPGNKLINNDGSPRATDLSGLFAGVSLRFYIF